MALETDGQVMKWARAARSASQGDVQRAKLKIAADAMICGYDPTSPRINLALRFLDEMGSNRRE